MHNILVSYKLSSANMTDFFYLSVSVDIEYLIVQAHFPYFYI